MDILKQIENIESEEGFIIGELSSRIGKNGERFYWNVLRGHNMEKQIVLTIMHVNGSVEYIKDTQEPVYYCCPLRLLDYVDKPITPHSARWRLKMQHKEINNEV